ncbi:rhomboid family intramembrane serine protease [Vulcanimicrobium alpinum]|uniref:Rhomboid family intramembrane serine protease n=1 Tax=Vulcanimicrobium alpinum TaxID=3016050 RepID=A0AAN2C9E8_UNVUL|nr:rhomboid family intramembrane serine protease [Vulcanimicrobium alpinum]BDE06465.1 rhomboid family intramembrane serine protease [Vulcanimicrobium alpinum]
MIPIGDDERRPIFPFVVYLVVAINVYVFVQELASGPGIDRFIGAFAAIPYDITHDVALAPPSPPVPALTIVTSMFLHGSIPHIAFNMLFLLVFGPAVEYLCGHLRFAVFYLLSGIAGGIAQIAIGPNSHIPALGASGAIAGVLGAYLVNFPLARVRTIVPIGCFPLFLRLPAIVVIGIWALTQFLNGFGSVSDRAAASQGGTAYFAHIGGFCAGVIMIGFFKIRDTAQRRAYRYYY